ncbi:MAG: hypothetical protein PHQ46_10730 [Negativicutes bacterium]|nr:hypothetical protein [Negativicutes bacterium]
MEEMEDGGINPESIGINYPLCKGASLIPRADYYDFPYHHSGSYQGRILDAVPIPTTVGSLYAVASNGNHYRVTSDSCTRVYLDYTTGAYGYGYTQTVSFGGDIFIPTTDDIIRVPGGTGTPDLTWWSNTRGHGKLAGATFIAVIGDTMYVGNQCYISTWDGGDSVKNALTLPSSMSISCMHQNPLGDNLLVWTNDGYASVLDHNQEVKAFMYVIDTITLEILSFFPVPERTEAAENMNGQTFITYGDNFGYVVRSSSGSPVGYKLIRKLNVNAPIYQPRMKKIGPFIAIAEKEKLLMYGDVNGMGNIFFYLGRANQAYYDSGETPWQDVSVSSDIIDSVFSIRTAIDENIVGMGIYGNGETTGGFIRLIDLKNRGTLPVIIKTKKYKSGRVWIRKIYVESESLQNGDSLDLKALHQDGTWVTVGTYTYAGDGAVNYKQMECNVLTSAIQLQLTWNRFAINKLSIFYESDE